MATIQACLNRCFIVRIAVSCGQSFDCEYSKTNLQVKTHTKKMDSDMYRTCHEPMPCFYGHAKGYSIQYMWYINTSNHKNINMWCNISRNWPNNTPRAWLCARSWHGPRLRHSHFRTRARIGTQQMTSEPRSGTAPYLLSAPKLTRFGCKISQRKDLPSTGKRVCIRTGEKADREVCNC